MSKIDAILLWLILGATVIVNIGQSARIDRLEAAAAIDKARGKGVAE